MAPIAIGPNYHRLAELAEEFTERWDQLQALYLDAAAGFLFVRRAVVAEQVRARSFVQGTELDSDEFQDSRQFSYSSILDDDFATARIHRATQGQVKFRNLPNGINFATLGQLCLVSFYDFWNDYLRKEYVVAKGYLAPDETNKETIDARVRDHASHDLWGDLRLLRQSIVHNRGIAIADVSKCKLIKWFQPGDPITITPEHMRILLVSLLIYRNQLFTEQFPSQHIIIE